MKVQHKNSKEEFDLSKPQYTKLFGQYGYLAMGVDSVFFIADGDQNLGNLLDVTAEFNIL